jgi:hypothetical protein
MAWVRTDGRKIADDPALLQQGKSDVAACDANLDSGSPTASARGCMAQKGYVLVRRDQAEDVRAPHAIQTKDRRERLSQDKMKRMILLFSTRTRAARRKAVSQTPSRRPQNREFNG